MKKLILFIAVCCLVNLIFAQHQAPGFLLDQQLTGNQHFQASDSIDMVPDFEYVPGPGEEFLAEIDPYLLFPPQEGIYDQGKRMKKINELETAKAEQFLN